MIKHKKFYGGALQSIDVKQAQFSSASLSLSLFLSLCLSLQKSNQTVIWCIAMMFTIICDVVS